MTLALPAPLEHPLRDMVLLRVHETASRLEEWALVLASVGVSSRIEPGQATFHLLVADEDHQRAEETLRAFVEENRPAAAEPTGEHGPSWLGWIVAVALVGFFAVTGGRSEAGWFVRGSADAARMLAGEWWRAVTALTLHADLAHVMSNALAAVVLVGALARIVGPGVSALLLVIAGALGNVATALVHRVDHDSVGASTAIFAAIGALAAISFVARRRSRAAWRRPWLALAAALALFGLLGTAKGTDLFAHAFGLLFGALVALPIARLRAPARALQALLALASLLTISGAWWLALR